MAGIVLLQMQGGGWAVLPVWELGAITGPWRACITCADAAGSITYHMTVGLEADHCTDRADFRGRGRCMHLYNPGCPAHKSDSPCTVLLKLLQTGPLQYA